MHTKFNKRFFRLTLLLVLILVLVQSALAFNLTLSWVNESNQNNAYYGNSVSSGDFNGDGYDDVLVGADMYNSPNLYDHEGSFFIYYGSSGGISLSPNFTGVGNPAEESARFGKVISSGDFNGDGYDDVLVGVPHSSWFNNLKYTYAGRTSICYGPLYGSRSCAGWSPNPGQKYAEYGSSVSSGDFNGDGYDDVLAGAPLYDNGETDEGRAFVYYGSSSGFSWPLSGFKYPGWSAESNQANARFGSSVSSGDFNGDGYDDVLVGAPLYDNGESNEGRVYVYYGGPSGISSSADWIAESNQGSAWFGYSVASGDFNNDSYDDVLVGALYYDNGQSNEGRVFVYYGGPSGISLEPDWTAESNQNDSDFGVSVSSGDFNGDGYDDVLVGAQGYDDKGGIFIYFGGPSGISSEANWSAESNQAGAHFGISVSSGDFDGNGYDDVLVGAEYYDNGEVNEGRAYVYLYSLQLPIYTNFISFPHTTNLSAVPDITNVTNLTLETLYGMLQFPHNHSVNAEGKDLDAHIKFGDCYVSVNLSGLDYTFNATAYLLMNNSDNHCGSDRIYYAPGVYNNADDVRQHDTVCSDCEKLIADNHKVKFKVYHFSSYAIGSNANLTIYDHYEGSSAQPNADIIFYANYTNKSGSHISGATCTIYFDGNTSDKHNMTDNGNNYNYTFSFGSTGTHNYNITCSATNYNTLSAVDDVEVSSVVPEFSSLVLFLITFVALVVVLMLRHRTK